MSSNLQNKPLKKKSSFFSKIKNFFNDIPDNQTIIINEASQVNPPNLKRSQSHNLDVHKPKKHKDLAEIYKIHEELDKSDELAH